MATHDLNLTVEDVAKAYQALPLKQIGLQHIVHSLSDDIHRASKVVITIHGESRILKNRGGSLS